MTTASRDLGAAASALGAYLTTVLPRARRELRRWGPLPREKALNAEAVAVFATLAPRSARPAATRAITRLQVAIDLRDELEELGSGEPLESPLLRRLELGWREEVAALPAYPAVSSLLARAVERCEAGQRQTHATAAGDAETLRRWALRLETPLNYRWWEVAAGASSSVAAHALIAAAADPATTTEDAVAIDVAYNPPIGALTVLLDDLVDRERDRDAGEHNYLAYYAGSVEAANRLAAIASQSERLIEPLPRARRHAAILAGVAAFYFGDPEAKTAFAEPIRERVLSRLGPGTQVLMAFSRLRRRRRQRKRPGQAGNSPGP